MNCRAVPVGSRDRIASRDLTSEYLDQALAQLKKYETWAAGFSETLAHARLASTELGEPLVWQDDFVDFWEPFTVIQEELIGLYEGLRRVNAALADLIEAYIDPPQNAQIEYGTENARFLDREGYHRRQIAYSVDRLKAWHRNFAHWVRVAIREIEIARREI
jgi:hypothetical protein